MNSLVELIEKELPLSLNRGILGDAISSSEQYMLRSLEWHE
jgi:hypothetical protein